MTVWKVMIQRGTVVEFSMNDKGGSGAGCFKVKVWADTTKFMNVTAARFRKCSDLDREGKVLIKNKTKVASGVGFSESSPVF